jgi:hypothetical protein
VSRWEPQCVSRRSPILPPLSSEAVDVSRRRLAGRSFGELVSALPGFCLRERVEDGLRLQLRRLAQILEGKVELSLSFIDRGARGVIPDFFAIDPDGAAEIAQRTRVVILSQPRGSSPESASA